MPKSYCDVCGDEAAELLTATCAFRVGFWRKPRSFAAGTRFCTLHLQEGLRDGHPYCQLVDAQTSPELLREWLSELRGWLQDNDQGAPGWYQHSFRYHLIGRHLESPGVDIESLKYLLSLTIAETRGIDLSSGGRFH